MASYKEEVNAMAEEVETHLKIIARYDEVICDKAPKHSILEMKTEMTQKNEQLEQMDKKLI